MRLVSRQEMVTLADTERALVANKQEAEDELARLFQAMREPSAQAGYSGNYESRINQARRVRDASERRLGSHLAKMRRVIDRREEAAEKAEEMFSSAVRSYDMKPRLASRRKMLKAVLVLEFLGLDTGHRSQYSMRVPSNYRGEQ